jgi:hypothetical protein
MMSTCCNSDDPHPMNVAGDFYVMRNHCIACMLPEDTAPELMGFHEGDEPYKPETPPSCFFKKQPSTPNEVETAIRILGVSCVDAIRYRGQDRAILERLKSMGLERLCDHKVV